MKTNPSGATGKFITIDFDDGRRARMLHLYRVLRNVGDRVRRGEQVAVSGASSWGDDWGGDAHVHITLWPTHRYVFGPYGTIDFQQYTEQNSGRPAGLDDEMTPEQAAMLKALYDAVFKGGDSMVDKKRSISASLAGIVSVVDSINSTVSAQVRRDGKQVPQIQDNADTNSMVRQLLVRPPITPEQVKVIADAVAAKIGTPSVVVDYVAVAKAVNDDAARRMAG